MFSAGSFEFSVKFFKQRNFVQNLQKWFFLSQSAIIFPLRIQMWLRVCNDRISFCIQDHLTIWKGRFVIVQVYKCDKLLHLEVLITSVSPDKNWCTCSFWIGWRTSKLWKSFFHVRCVIFYFPGKVALVLYYFASTAHISTSIEQNMKIFEIPFEMKPPAAF